MLWSAAMVSSMLMFLLHPRTLIKKNRHLYCSYNKIAFNMCLKNKSIMFCNKSTVNSEEFEPYLFAVAQKLMRQGCSMFVRNVAVMHKFRQKRAIHVDMIAFNPKKNKIFALVYSSRSSNLAASWRHNTKFTSVAKPFVQKGCEVVQLVVSTAKYPVDGTVGFRWKPQK